MSRATSLRAWNIFLAGGALVVLASISFYTIYGSGPTFPPSQFYTWPVAAIGGVMVGYALPDLASIQGGRRLKILVAVLGGTLAWTVQIYIQAIGSAAVDFRSGAPTGIALGFVIAVFTVAVVEIRARLKERNTR